MKKLSTIHALAFTTALLMTPALASAQQQGNVPKAVQDAEEDIESAVRRWGIGVQGGVAVDPELIMFGAHGTFGPIFRPGVQFRPGIEFGVGEVTTSFGVNLDVLYTLPGVTSTTRWSPYIGGGPNVGVSHRSFEDDDPESIEDNRNRFDFGDTDFDAGFNFIAGARSRGGLFFEMRASAYGVSNVKLLAGFNF